MFINDRGLIKCPNPQGGPWPQLSLQKPFHVNPDNGNIRVWFYLEYEDDPPTAEWMAGRDCLLVSLEAPKFDYPIYRRFCYAELSNPKQIYAGVSPDHLLDIMEGWIPTKDEPRYQAKELLDAGYEMIIYNEQNQFGAFIRNPAKYMINCTYTEAPPWNSLG